LPELVGGKQKEKQTGSRTKPNPGPGEIKPTPMHLFHLGANSKRQKRWPG
jgi:hypothetical protein